MPSLCCRSTFRQGHSTHPLPQVPSFQGTLVRSHEVEPKAGSVLPNQQKSLHALSCSQDSTNSPCQGLVP